MLDVAKKDARVWPKQKGITQIANKGALGVVKTEGHYMWFTRIANKGAWVWPK